MKQLSKTLKINQLFEEKKGLLFFDNVAYHRLGIVTEFIEENKILTLANSP